MDRITSIIIKNVRSIESLQLKISPLTVLIGENGSGKSTIIECLELLRKAVEPDFIEKVYTVHGGAAALLRKGATSLTLGLTIEESDRSKPTIEYFFRLSVQNNGLVVSQENLTAFHHDTKQPTLVRTASEIALFSVTTNAPKPQTVPIRPDQLFISFVWDSNEATHINRLKNVLKGIEAHLPFDTTPSWAARHYNLQQRIRGPSTHFPANNLQLLGFNLANAWSALKNKNSQHWEYTLDLLKLGLGDRIDTVNVAPDPGGGNIHLLVQFTDLAEGIPVSALSDGQISWLAFVAMVRLNETRSFLAIDEPELHLHPHLLRRTLDLLAGTKEKAPVLLATHSDRVLEMLPDPAESLRVCELDGSRLVVRHLDKQQLPKWLEKFGNISEIRRLNRLEFVLESGEQK